MKVLLVDDEEIPRNAIKLALESSNYTVSTSADGELALAAIEKDKYDLVLSDIRMPNMTGVQLLDQIKQREGKVPVILMTGFSDICDAIEAHRLGAIGFLAKPFELSELLDVIKGIYQNPGLTQSSDDNYVKLPLDDFISGKEILYDIFLSPTANKFIKVAHQGENIERERILAYKERGLSFLYLRKEDFIKYMGFNVELGKAVAKSNEVMREKKLHLLRHTGEIISQYMRFDGVDQEAFDTSKSFIETALSILAEEESTFNLIAILSEHSDYLYAHSVGVSMLSVMLAKQSGWTTHPTLFKIAMGGFFHDVGKKDMCPVIVAKMRGDLNHREVSLLDTHPSRGVEILKEIPSIPNDVLQIVLQHHENCLGQGFPSGLTRSKIYPMARLISVANEYCNLAFKAPGKPPMSPMEAVMRVKQTGAGRLDSVFVEALGNLFDPKVQNKGRR